jgi:hypothetical protein
MRRKILMGVLAIALPIGTMSVVSSSAFAGKPKPLPDPARNCTLSGTVNFAAPGLSKNGTTDTSTKTSSVTTSGTNFGGSCTGSIPTQTITSKSAKCTGAGTSNTGPNPGCSVKHTYNYDGESTFASPTTLGTITKSLKKVNFTINGVSYQTKTTGAQDLACGAEVGFKISGQVKKPKQDKAQTSTVDVCLGSDTGPGTTGNFLSDLGSGTGTIATAQIDPAFSTAVVQ